MRHEWAARQQGPGAARWDRCSLCRANSLVTDAEGTTVRWLCRPGRTGSGAEAVYGKCPETCEESAALEVTAS